MNSNVNEIKLFGKWRAKQAQKKKNHKKTAIFSLYSWLYNCIQPFLPLIDKRQLEIKVKRIALITLLTSLFNVNFVDSYSF